MKGFDFVFTGLQPWDLLMGSNARDIAIEISKNNRVLYINTPLDRYPALIKTTAPEFVHRKAVVNKERSILRQINDNLWVADCPFITLPVNRLPDGFLFDMANRYNNKKIFSFVKKICESLGFKDIIHFIDNDIYRSFYAKEYLDAKLRVYYRRDNLANDYWKKHAPRLEPLLSAKCDIVLANSEELAAAVKSYNSLSYNVGQGVDLGSYDPQSNIEIPSDLKDIPSPIVGYTGMILVQRLDSELMYDLAKSSQYSFVFVGAEDDHFRSHPLHQLKNVYFLGMKPLSSVPDYIKGFDVCINPQAINPITIGNYPRKIDEYLAMGKPVVATKTDTMSMFEGYSYNCNGVEEYKKAIDAAILEANDSEMIQKRIAFAHTHSWENSVGKIYHYISSSIISKQTINK